MERMISVPQDLLRQPFGNYLPLSLLRTTRRSWIFLAEDDRLKRKVALKVLKPNQPSERREQFLREGARLAQVEDHPHITTVYYGGEVNGLPYIAMKWIDGKTLQDILDANEVLSTRRIEAMVAETTSALVYSHEQGVEHNDIKPKNIIEHNKGTLHVLDFGSRVTRDANTNDVVAMGGIIKCLLEHAQEKARVKGLEEIVQFIDETRPPPSIFMLQDEVRKYFERKKRRAFIKQGALYVAGTFVLGSVGKMIQYTDSFDFLVDELKTETRPQKIDGLFLDIKKKIFSEKIKGIIERREIPRGKFPHGTQKGGGWFTSAKPSYSNGFWPGILWTGYEATRDERFKGWAEEWTKDIQLGAEDAQFTTAVRFFHSYAKGFDTCLACEGEERDDLKVPTLHALDLLAKKFNPTIGFIPLSEETTEFEASLLGDVIPFFCWGYRMTQNPRYRDIAKAHVQTILTYNKRPDGSFAKTAVFDPDKKQVLREENVNGYGSCGVVSRVQAQVTLGLLETWAITRDPTFLDHAQKTIDYVLKKLPRNNIPPCDLNAPRTMQVPPDSSALALEQFAIGKLAHLTKERKWETLQRNLKKSLITECLITKKDKAGILNTACSNMNTQSYVDVSLIYGDYYFLDS